MAGEPRWCSAGLFAATSIGATSVSSPSPSLGSTRSRRCFRQRRLVAGWARSRRRSGWWRCPRAASTPAASASALRPRHPAAEAVASGHEHVPPTSSQRPRALPAAGRAGSDRRWGRPPQRCGIRAQPRHSGRRWFGHSGTHRDDQASPATRSTIGRLGRSTARVRPDCLDVVLPHPDPLRPVQSTSFDRQRQQLALPYGQLRGHCFARCTRARRVVALDGCIDYDAAAEEAKAQRGP